MTAPNQQIPDYGQVCRELSGFLRSSVLADRVQFDEHTPLAEAGVDSFSFVEIVLFVERRFGLSVPDSRLTRDDLESVGTIARLVCELLSRGVKLD